MKIIPVKLLSLLVIFFSGEIFSMPSTTLINKSPYLQFGDDRLHTSSISVIKTQIRFNGNNIDSWIQNTGTFDQDIRTNNTPGFMWPKGSNKFAVFTAGLCIAAYYNDTLRMATASYNGEYAPGYIENGIAKTDSRFKLYSVYSGDNANSNPDYANWGLMVPYGAPYVDVNNNKTYDNGVDIPGIKDAAQTIFVCLTDGFTENHTSSEGFSGGTLPLYAEVHLTAWCYNTPALENVQFFRYNVINKSNATWEKTFFSFVEDTDLGDATDDYIGCDTIRDLAYSYNADNIDGKGSPYQYGESPPAVGMDWFKSPAKYTGNPNDSVVYFDPRGSNNKIIKQGWRAIGLTSSVLVIGTGSGGPFCESDPSQPVQAYRIMTGVKKDGTPWVTPSGFQQTKFCYSGEPESFTGWTERGTNGNPNLGKVDNCNGELTGNVHASYPGNRTFVMSSGDSTLNVSPNDTQNIVIGQFIVRGYNNFNSVTKLKKLSEVIQSGFNNNFYSNPNPIVPVVTSSFKQTGSKGTAEVTLNWDNRSESYNVLDSLTQALSDNCYLKFQGYQIFELSLSKDSIPDFNDSGSDFTGIHLLKIYDVADSIGIIVDTLPTGIINNFEEQYVIVPVVPFHNSPVPSGFPNQGITRSLRITKTTFPDEHNGKTDLIYGQPYKFAVVAYAYRTNPKFKSERKTIFCSLDSSVFTITPTAPLAGSSFSLKNGDTLYTNRRDLGVMPIIRDQQQLLTAKYRVQFQYPDTSYQVLRSMDGNTFDTLSQKLHLSYTQPGKPAPDDSSKLFDGVMMKVQKIFNYNIGVIKDPGNRDSTQTRLKGWEYSPTSNIYLTRSDSSINSLPFQNKSMSITWPTPTSFTGSGTALSIDSLKIVKIKYTGYGNGQYALRYLNRSNNPPADSSFIPHINIIGGGLRYQDIREVPFKVFTEDVHGNQIQVMCAFTENNDSLYIKRGGVREYAGWGLVDGKWNPTTYRTGGIEILYIFNSRYNNDTTSSRYIFYKGKNLRIDQAQFDIMYVWAPKKISENVDFKTGDEFTIYPYTNTRPYIVSGVPLYYEFETTAPILGSTDLAVTQNDLDKIRVVPNPFYGYNEFQTSSLDRFVTFRRLPKKCTISIYTLSGLLVRQIEKDNDDSSLIWDLNNSSNSPVASGMFIALIDAQEIGQKVIKLAVFTASDE